MPIHLARPIKLVQGSRGMMLSTALVVSFDVPIPSPPSNFGSFPVIHSTLLPANASRLEIVSWALGASKLLSFPYFASPRDGPSGWTQRCLQSPQSSTEPSNCPEKVRILINCVSAFGGHLLESWNSHMPPDLWLFSLANVGALITKP